MRIRTLCVLAISSWATLSAQALTKVHAATKAYHLSEAHDHLFFSTDIGGDLWMLGPTGTSRKLRFPGTTEPPVAIGHRLFLSAYRPSRVGGRMLQVLDLRTHAVTALPIPPGKAYQVSPRRLVAWRGRIWFIATGRSGTELYQSDGTTAGTRIVKDIRRGAASSNPRNLTPFRDRLYFQATDDTTTGLWVTDGTATGTRLVFRGGYPYGASNLTVLGDRLVFIAGFPGIGVSDGTARGTRFLAALNPKPGRPLYGREPLAVVGDYAYFIQGPKGGEELYRTDGKTISLVKDIRPGAQGSGPHFLAPFGNRLLFAADDGVAGREPWITDGTAKGTVLLADIVPGKNSVLPFNFTAVSGRRALFAAGGLDAAGKPTGFELHETDGTRSGTRMVVNLTPGGTTTPREFTMVGGRVFFATRVGVYRLDVGATSHAVPTGCDRTISPQLRSTDPAFGTTMTMRVQSARPQSRGVMMFGRRAGVQHLTHYRNGCHWYLDFRLPTLPLALQTDPAVSWRWTVPIPRLPIFNGARFAAQAVVDDGRGGMQSSELLILRLGW